MRPIQAGQLLPKRETVVAFVMPMMMAEHHRRHRQYCLLLLLPSVANYDRRQLQEQQSYSIHQYWNCHSISICTIIIKIGNRFDVDNGKVGAARVDTLKKIG